MARVLSEYEVAWRKSAGHPVPADGVHRDDDELEALTAPPVTSPVVTPEPAPVAPSATQQPAKPTGKK